MNLHSNSEYIVALCPATPLYLVGDWGPAQNFRTMTTRIKGDARRFATFDEARDVSAAVCGWLGSRVEEVAKYAPTSAEVIADLSDSAITTFTDILRARIERDTAALRATPPSGYDPFGPQTLAEMRDNFNFLRGMIHAYYVAKNFNGTTYADGLSMADDAHDALKTAKKTRRDWKAQNAPTSDGGFGPEIHLTK